MAEKSKRKKRPAKSENTTLLQRTANITRKLFQPVPLITLAAALIAAFLLRTSAKWLPDLDHRAEYRITADSVEVSRGSEFVPSDLVAQAFHKSDLPPELSLLETSTTQQIYEALQRHPWVEQVTAVRKHVPARVTAELEYRQPVAMVEVPRGVYPIDRHGTLLPPEDFSVEDARSFLLITGVRSTPQGPPGTSWGDPAVDGAALIAEQLMNKFKEYRLQKIHCGQDRIDDAATYKLISHGGSRIIWGYAPDETRPGEPDTREKLKRLRKYRERFGGFEKPDGPYEINIRHWQEISRRPLTVKREQRKSL